MSKRRPPLNKKVLRAIRAALTYYDTCLSTYGVDFEDVDSEDQERSYNRLMDDNSAAFSWLRGVEDKRGVQCHAISRSSYSLTGSRTA